MAKTNQFQDNLSAMGGDLMKKAKQKTTAIANEFESLDPSITNPQRMQAVPMVNAGPVSQVTKMVNNEHKKIGRPKEYQGEQAVITIKTNKEIKDIAVMQMHRKGMNMVKYISYLIMKDYKESGVGTYNNQFGQY